MKLYSFNLYIPSLLWLVGTIFSCELRFPSLVPCLDLFSCIVSNSVVSFYSQFLKFNSGFTPAIHALNLYRTLNLFHLTALYFRHPEPFLEVCVRFQIKAQKLLGISLQNIGSICESEHFINPFFSFRNHLAAPDLQIWTSS